MGCIHSQLLENQRSADKSVDSADKCVGKSTSSADKSTDSVGKSAGRIRGYLHCVNA